MVGTHCPGSLPCAPFVSAVKDEMERLRALSGISQAEAQVEARFSELLGDRLQLRCLYDELRTAHERRIGRPQTTTARSDVH